MTDLNAEARQILTDNDRGGYTVPTGRLYPFQWNWDSMFAALGFATYDRDRAWDEIDSLMEAQWDCGFVPHIVFHDDNPDYFPGAAIWAAGNGRIKSSGITQPPVAATIVRTMLDDAGADAASRDRARILLPKLAAWHRWFRRVRDPLGNGLVLTLHPWETGRDNSPEWDAAMNAITPRPDVELRRHDVTLVDPAERPSDRQYRIYLTLVGEGRDTGWDLVKHAEISSFRMFDVGLSLILLRAERDLLALAEIFGETELAAEIAPRIALAETGVEMLWNSDVEAYCSYDLIRKQSTGMITNTSMLAPYAGITARDRLAPTLSHFNRMAAKARYTVASQDPDHESYSHKHYWRGPVWLVVNYMVGRGLAEVGAESEATRVYQDTKALVECSGFQEAYSSRDGSPSGGDSFTWSAAIWLAWASKIAADPDLAVQEV